MLSLSSCHSCVWLQASPLIFTLITWPSPLSFKARTSISMVGTKWILLWTKIYRKLHSKEELTGLKFGNLKNAIPQKSTGVGPHRLRNAFHFRTRYCLLLYSEVQQMLSKYVQFPPFDASIALEIYMVDFAISCMVLELSRISYTLQCNPCVKGGN